MQSSLNSRSRFRSSIEVLVALGTLAACGDDGNSSCGPGGAPDSGITAGDSTITMTYGGLHAGLNNDCPAADAPDGVVSVTITGTQTNGPGIITFCVERPDLLAAGAQSLGPATGSAQVHVFDVGGSANDCSFELDQTIPPSGTLSATGLCDNGASGAGFAIGVSGAVTLKQTCGSGPTTNVAVQLKGTVAVSADVAD